MAARVSGVWHTGSTRCGFSIIYKVQAERLDVFAFKGDRPDENSDLYLAPYFNVTGSAVCLGSPSLTKPQNPSFTEFYVNIPYPILSSDVRNSALHNLRNQRNKKHPDELPVWRPVTLYASN